MFSTNIIKKRILIIGSNGLLGQRLVKFLIKNSNFEILGSSVEDKSIMDNYEYKQCDLTNREGIKELVYNFYPDVIINAAAYTNVDKSETERETAWKINVKGVEYLAEACRVMDTHLIHFSTDYIFDGTNGPYSELAAPNPIGYYGRTKLASENALKISGSNYTILRTNVLYGPGLGRPDFVRWLVAQLKDNKKVNIVIDQINNPTFVDDLVQAASKVMEFKKGGVFNIGGREFLSRFDFSLLIAEFFNLNKEFIKPITTLELNQPAKRPLKSGLLTLKAETELGYKPHSIIESLVIMKKELCL
jgi:dTDP-4-dehydrorhamnose reductase